MNKRLVSSRLWILILSALAFTACDKNDDPTPTAGDAYVNTWIKENMDTWYYWNTTLPTDAPSKTMSPDAYFESLLNSEDRFSWIQDNYQELLNSLKGVSKESGYDIVLYRESPESSTVIAQVTYVKPNSPAAATSLKRGDVITRINDQQITVDNYRTLLEALGENHSLTYTPYDYATESFGDAQNVSLTAIEYAENPNYLSKVIEADGHKIGYYVYNFFAPGPDQQSTTYDDQMESIFATFKSAGITDLVLDLRYNTGGSEASARNLASLIGPNINTDKVFVRKQYNATVEDAIISEYGESFLVSNFLSKSSNVGAQLQNNRLYILSSARTASASELIINSLKPFMEVFIVGDTTYGKNVGSISIYEEDDPKNTWGMQPIVVKVFNSENESNYSEGFRPDIIDLDNSLHLKPLGDANEALLKHAIDHITGNDGGRIATTDSGRRTVGHSLDLKRRSFTLIMDEQEALRSVLK